ncbi:uncharacterized protein [Heptranchias perlo]|uniref:uncharacterized protein n=1 Tax=Heptranchias perlo TaxID=212740 RepID=UPI00355A46EF
MLGLASVAHIPGTKIGKKKKLMILELNLLHRTPVKILILFFFTFQVNCQLSVGNKSLARKRMSGYGPYFADDEESSEDKISQLGSANTTGNDQTKTSEASTKDGFSGHQDDSKSNGTSAFSSSYHTNEDNTSYVSTTFSDPNDHSSQKQAVSSKSKRQGTQNESKFCTDSSEVSCDDLVIVLEESKFLKVLEDVVKELVEKLVTEKISGRSSVASQKQISGNQSSRSKPGNKTVDIKRSFDKKVKDLTESQKNNLEKPGAGPDLSKRAQHEHTVSDEKLTPQSSQQKSSKTPSESTQGKTVQPKTKVNKNKASGAKANSASSRERAAESSPIHDLNASDNQTCYFKSKSSAAKKELLRTLPYRLFHLNLLFSAGGKDIFQKLAGSFFKYADWDPAAILTSGPERRNGCGFPARSAWREEEWRLEDAQTARQASLIDRLVSVGREKSNGEDVFRLAGANCSASAAALIIFLSKNETIKLRHGGSHLIKVELLTISKTKFEYFHPCSRQTYTSKLNAGQRMVTVSAKNLGG